jgi:predicted O-methyltransferase YrrM
MEEIPIYFNTPEIRKNFVYFFEEIEYFKNKKIKILHLGAYTGHGTRWMLEKCNATCLDVDIWNWSSEFDSELNIEPYSFYNETNVENLYNQTVYGLPTTKFKGTTADFFKQNTDTFDFIYIDASHKKSDVELDLAESWKVLNKNGVIACDDYLWHVEGDPWNEPTDNLDLVPYEAIKDFAKKHDKEIEILIDNYQFWFKKK